MPTISILITDYKIEKLKEIKSYHTIWNLREKEEQGKILTPNLEIHILEIPKMQEEGNEKEELRAWLKFLVDPESEEVRKMAEKDLFLKQAMNEIEHLKDDPDFERLLESRADWLRDQYSFRKEAQREGTEQGIKQGIEQGSRKEKIKIAKKMKENQTSIEQIILYTGLDKNEILKL